MIKAQVYVQSFFRTPLELLGLPKSHVEWPRLRFTALFTTPPDGLPPYRRRSGGHSVWQFPIDIFPFCRERPVTKEPVALWIAMLDAFSGTVIILYSFGILADNLRGGTWGPAPPPGTKFHWVSKIPKPKSVSGYSEPILIFFTRTVVCSPNLYPTEITEESVNQGWRWTCIFIFQGVLAVWKLILVHFYTFYDKNMAVGP